VESQATPVLPPQATHVVEVAHEVTVVHFCPVAFSSVSAFLEITQLMQFISIEFKEQLATSKLSKLPVDLAGSAT